MCPNLLVFYQYNYMKVLSPPFQVPPPSRPFNSSFITFMHLSGCQYKLGPANHQHRESLIYRLKKRSPARTDPSVIFHLQKCSKTGSFEVIRVYLVQQTQAVVKFTFHRFVSLSEAQIKSWKQVLYVTHIIKNQ